MRIRITDIEQTCPEEYQDVSLAQLGVSVGAVFDVESCHEYGFMVGTDDGPLFIRRSECEFLED